MKMLIQLIEDLLPEHDCVVVPGLGGFVQNEMASSRLVSDDLFYPRCKEIGFNPKLKFNDGLLAQAYQKVCAISFEEANECIREAVEELKNRLREGKFVRLGRIGTLSGEEDDLLFRNDLKNHFFPEVYGLTSFTFPKLKQDSDPLMAAALRPDGRWAAMADSWAETENERPSAAGHRDGRSEVLRTTTSDSPTTRKRDEFIHIRLHRSGFNRFVVGAAACLAFVMVSKPAGKVSPDNQQAAMLHEYVIKSPQTIKYPAATAVPGDEETLSDAVASSETASTVAVAENKTSPAVAVTENKTSSAGAAGESGKAEPVAAKPRTVAAPVSGKPVQKPATAMSGIQYHVVVSSFNYPESARRWQEEHKKDPVASGSFIVEGKGWARICVKTFQDRQAAQNYLSSFTREHPQYASAWVYCAKND